MKNCRKVSKLIAIVLALVLCVSLLISAFPFGGDVWAQSATPSDAEVETSLDEEAEEIEEELAEATTETSELDLNKDPIMLRSMRGMRPNLLGAGPNNLLGADPTNVPGAGPLNAPANVQDESMTFNIDFQKYNGETWILKESDVLKVFAFVTWRYNSDLTYPQGYWYEIQYYDINDQLIETVTQGSVDYPISTQYSPINWEDASGKIPNGAKSCKLILHKIGGLAEAGNLDFNFLNFRTISRVVVDGEILDAYSMTREAEQKEEAQNRKQKIMVPFVDGAEHSVKVISPATYSGIVSFNSPDSSLVDDDYCYHFTLKLGPSGEANSNIDDFYWCYPNDSTKHYAIGHDSTGWNYYYISIPIGSYVEFHNVPPVAGFGWTLGNPLGDNIYNYSGTESDTEHKNVGVVTLNGNNIDSSLGISYRMHTDFVGGDLAESYKFIDRERPNLPTSGLWSGTWLGEGFEINVSISRNPVQFMFSKVYAEDDDLAVADEQHHFEVTLYDTEAKEPFTKKVGYYIYDSKDAEIDEDADVKYVTPDANGKFDVYLKAGQYIKVGRVMTPTYANELKSVYSNASTIERSYYYPDSGELPCGISYSIEEVGDKYTAAISGDASATVKDPDNYHYYVSTGTVGGYRNVNLSELETIMKGLDIEPAVFTNTRNTASLSVEKVVKGELEEKEFSFAITLTDGSGAFPKSLNVSSSLGTTSAIALTADSKISGVYNGTFNLKAGEKITINGIPVGTEYSVVETSDPAGKYTVEYTNNEGQVTSAGAAVVVTNTGVEAAKEEAAAKEASVTKAPNKETKTSAAKTGDNFGLQMMIICMLLSLAAILTLAYIKLRNE